MTKYLLNDADFDVAFQKMDSEAVAQTMDGCGLVYATLQESRFKRALNGSDVDVSTVWSWKEPPFCLVVRQNSRRHARAGSERGTLRSFPPLPLRTQSRLRSLSISSILSLAASETRSPQE